MLLYFFLFIILAQIALSEANKIYFINIGYDGSKYSEISTIQKEGFVFNIPGSYTYELLSFDGRVLETLSFNFPLEIVRHEHKTLEDDSLQSVDTINPNNETIVMGNYFKNGKIINIYDADKNKVLSIDVGYLADVCGDNICEAHEDSQYCPADCKDIKRPTVYGLSKLLAFILPFIFIFLIMFIVYLMGREKRR